MPPHLKNERDELVVRCQLGLKQYDKIIATVAANDASSPAMKALAMAAAYQLLLLSSSADNDDDDDDNDVKKKDLLDALRVLLAECPRDTSVQLTVCHVYLSANLVRGALSCVYMGLTMEHLAMCAQIYIKIDRHDLADETLSLLKQADEDSVLVQLTSVYICLAQGASKADDATHTLLTLTEQYGPSLMLLNYTAVANMVGGRYDIAEMNLKEAISNYDGSSDTDTLVNMIVCAQYLGKSGNTTTTTSNDDDGKGGEVEGYVKTLKTICATHPYVQGLVQVEGAFDREANKYLTV